MSKLGFRHLPREGYRFRKQGNLELPQLQDKMLGLDFKVFPQLASFAIAHAWLDRSREVRKGRDDDA